MSTQTPSQTITTASADFSSSEAKMIAQVDSDDSRHVFDENKLLMQLSPEDFAKVRRSDNGFFCISDAIGSFTECSEDSARKKWCQVALKLGGKNKMVCKESDPGCHSGVELPFPVKFFSFPYKGSRAERSKVAPATEVSAGEKRGVACTNLRGLLTILSQFEHPRCKKLQAEMIQVAWCAMAGLPIVLPSAESKQTPSSQATKKPAVRQGQRSLPQATTEHNASSTKAITSPEHELAQVLGSKQQSEPTPGLDDLVSIITNPKHPRSRECCIDLIAISLRATTGNSELASKLANVLASSLEKAGGVSPAEEQQQGSSDTAQATSSTEPVPLSEPEHEQVQRRKQQPRESLQEPVAKRPRLSSSHAISKQALGKDNASSALLVVDQSLAATAPTVLTSDGNPELTPSTSPAERVDKVETEKQELSVSKAQEQPPQPAPKSSSTNDTAVSKTKLCKVDEPFPVEPRDKATQSVVMSRGLHDLQNWEEQDISNPSGKRVLRQILTKMKSLYKRSEVNVAPLYLGYVKPLTNTKRFMSRGQVRNWIKKNKKNPFLRDYFDGKGRRKLAWHVDHIIPASVGGLDHPRNYAIMPQIFNTEFGGWWSAAKAQYITVTAARHALLFAQYARKKLQRDVRLDDLEMWKFLIGAAPVFTAEDTEAPEDRAQHPAGSTCKGDPRWSRLMNEQARVFCEKLARSLTLNAKQVRDEYLNSTLVSDEEDADSAAAKVAAAARLARANEEAVVALRQAIYSEVVRVVCARLPRCNLNSTNLPLAHLFLYLVRKNAWGRGEDHETELELEATLGKEVLGEDLHLYTLDEPHGLVQIDTPEFELRIKSLRLLRENNSDAIQFFEERGIPSKLANGPAKRKRRGQRVTTASFSFPSSLAQVG
eukprot:g32680.t1